jgi:hypothetical protein
MTTLAILTGLGAVVGAVLFAAGYLVCLYRGTHEREDINKAVRRPEEPVKQPSRQSADPHVKPERPSLELEESGANAVQRRDLTPLMDKIAASGRFTMVFLSDDAGLPLAHTSTYNDLERLVAAPTRLAIVADQISGEEGADPHSIMLRDASGTTMLCRIFRIRGQRLSLTALSNDLRLTSVALDPALLKIEAALATWP